MIDDSLLQISSLVLYKRRPARVIQIEPRLEIELEDGNRAKVRSKDVLLIHPGPLQSLKDLTEQKGEIELAWQIMSEVPQNKFTLPAMAELIFGNFSPATAWATWKIIEDGYYFNGSPDEISANTTETISRIRNSRQQQAEQAKAWEDFINRLDQGQVDPSQDAAMLRDVEDLAYGRRSDSRVLRALGRIERPENAHALLLNIGFWEPAINPHPVRLKLTTRSPEISGPEFTDEPRLDLTHLQAFAIDDSQNNDPDDAISLDEIEYDSRGEFKSGKLWVHIADVASIVQPDSALDLEARGRGASLYLPEGTVSMLPETIINRFGLGIQDISPSLSFHISMDKEGEVTCLGIHAAWVKVSRVSYENTETMLDREPFRSLFLLSQVYQLRRQKNGASLIDLPEVIIRVISNQVEIRPILPLNSRAMVREAMLMAGEIAAKYAIQHHLPFPYATQEGSKQNVLLNLDSKELFMEENMASQYALRRNSKRSRVSSLPAPHAGVGLPIYSRSTSPLRRYMDLVVHQQLRAHLLGTSLINQQEMVNRVGMSEAITSNIRQAESLSRRHWTLVYLMQNPEWLGEAILVEREGLRGRVLIPELALECQLNLREELPVNTQIKVRSGSINLPELEISLKIIG